MYKGVVLKNCRRMRGAAAGENDRDLGDHCINEYVCISSKA